MKHLRDCINKELEIGDYVVLANQVEALNRNFEVWQVIGDGTYNEENPIVFIRGLYSGKSDSFYAAMLKKIDLNKITKEYESLKILEKELGLNIFDFIACIMFEEDEMYIVDLARDKEGEELNYYEARKVYRNDEYRFNLGYTYKEAKKSGMFFEFELIDDDGYTYELPFASYKDTLFFIKEEAEQEAERKNKEMQK